MSTKIQTVDDSKTVRLIVGRVFVSLNPETEAAPGAPAVAAVPKLPRNDS
jgi:hypothetical protein